MFYQENLKLPNVVFDAKINNSNYNDNVLGDFFSMLEFDCLIRSRSTFAQIIDLLGNFKVKYYPKHNIMIDNKPFIDEIAFLIEE